MNYISFVFLIVIFINGFAFTLAKNSYYIISIRRNKNDKDYDEASRKVQNALDELVNDRMNDIYEIISDNEDTFILKNGKQDEKLKELESNNLKKRHEGNTKWRFKNINRPQTSNKKSKRSSNEVEIESQLVSYVCPVKNYYTIIAYLSDKIVDEIKKLPNVISCQKSQKLKELSYYNLNSIKKETYWSGVEVQENKLYATKFSYLSLISQGRYYKKNNNSIYDNNYYYPSSAGKGIDIYFIDSGIWTNHNDFDTYRGERSITCDVVISAGNYHTVKNKNKCSIYSDSEDETSYPEHGVMVSSVAAGKLYGVAKKANIHMIASELTVHDYLASFDYVKQHGKPYKTILSISNGGFGEYSMDIQNKIDELKKYGIIIVSSAGNDSENICEKRSDGFVYLIGGYNNVITVGATKDVVDSIEDGYHAADYSNFGKCVDVFGPGTVSFADSERGRTTYSIRSGTSCSTPIVAGVIANIMSEHPNIKYNYETIRNLLTDMSLKNALQNLGSSDTPNRFLNNGNRLIHEPYRCDDPSGNHKCSNGCCSKDGICYDIEDNYGVYNLGKCLMEHGCQSKFGKCASYDDLKRTNTSSGEREIIIKGTCDYEKQKLDSVCHFYNSDSINISTFAPSYLNAQCNDYINYHCKEYYKDPYNYIESCRYSKKLYNVKLSYHEDMRKEEVTHNFLCARESQKDGWKRCGITDAIYYSQYEDESDLEKAIIQSCASKECHDSFNDYNEYFLEEYRNYRLKNLYRENKSRKNALMSEQCISLYNKVMETPATTTTTTTTTKVINKYIPSPTVSDRCGPNYGVCAKGYCCSRYGYCGKTVSYCGTGCQSEFGRCSSSSNTNTKTASPAKLVKTTTTTTTKKVTTTRKVTTTTKKATANKKVTTTKKTTTTKKANVTTKKTTALNKKTTTIKSVKKTTTTAKVSKSTVSERCGPKFGSCANAKQCCSRYGYCGTTSSYCGVGCQPSYGICH